MRFDSASILCVGEAMIELSETNFSKRSTAIGIAGDTLNTAIYIKRLLGDYVTVDYLTVLGVDAFSDHILTFIGSEGIGTNKIRRVSSRNPGLYAINTDLLGDRSFCYWRDNSAAKTLFEVNDDFETLAGYDFIYYSGISLAILNEKARDAFLGWVMKKQGEVSFFFDSNYRKSLWSSNTSARSAIHTAFRNSSIAFASLDDQKQLTGEFDESVIVDGLTNSGAPQIVLKRGAAGPRLIGEKNVNPSFQYIRNVVDSTAAGDSFNAGFISAYLEGNSYFKCAKRGHELASIVVQHPGAVCPMSKLHNYKNLSTGNSH